MNHTEIVDLLTTAAAYDQRTTGQADVHAWHDAASRGRWTYPEALDAIKAHYAEQTTRIMPAHVTHHIRATRQDVALRQSLPPSQSEPPGRLSELAAGAFQAIGVEPHDYERRHGARQHPCPHCNATAGSPCTRRGQRGHVPLKNPHPSRREVAS